MHPWPFALAAPAPAPESARAPASASPSVLAPVGPSARRRRSGRADKIIHYRDITLFPDSMRVEYLGADVVLSRREYVLLQELLTNTGRVLTRDQLEEAVYEMGQDVASNTIEVHVHHLRKKFYNDLIRTVRGVGYLVEKA